MLFQTYGSKISQEELERIVVTFSSFIDLLYDLECSDIGMAIANIDVEQEIHNILGCDLSDLTAKLELVRSVIVGHNMDWHLCGEKESALDEKIEEKEKIKKDLENKHNTKRDIKKER